VREVDEYEDPPRLHLNHDSEWTRAMIHPREIARFQQENSTSGHSPESGSWGRGCPSTSRAKGVTPRGGSRPNLGDWVGSEARGQYLCESSECSGSPFDRPFGRNERCRERADVALPAKRDSGAAHLRGVDGWAASCMRVVRAGGAFGRKSLGKVSPRAREAGEVRLHGKGAPAMVRVGSAACASAARRLGSSRRARSDSEQAGSRPTRPREGGTRTGACVSSESPLR
jgi:hypothetical protein